MPGALKKSMMWLGLAEEDEDYEDGYETRRPSPEMTVDEVVDVRERRREPAAAVTPINRERTMPSLVRETSTTAEGEIARISTIHPRSYNDAKSIGESFRQGIPVIMNLSDMGEADAKRLVDFSAGLVFGMHGTIERVTSKVFLLSPAGVEVTQEGAQTATGSSAAGFFNQS